METAVEIGSKVFHRAVWADLLTPVSAYLRVARGTARSFLLESVEGGERMGRYSFIGVEPTDSFAGNFADLRERFPAPVEGDPQLPPFTGGAVGTFGYELAGEFEALAGVSHPAPIELDFYPTVLAFDHLKHQIVIMSRESRRRVEEIASRLREPVDVWSEPGGGVASPPQLKSGFSRDRFCAAVERAGEYIAAGDIFQVVLSQRFETGYSGDPFNVYRALRFLNPSPYLFFIRRNGQSVVGSSPEMLVRVQGRRLDYRPIAGTRRRGATAAEDEALAAELLADAKERAEHLMLVDLGRNDLGRVSAYGSVSVDDFMFVERYSHVMHLVSALRGELRQGLDRFDALQACFPAGTVSGAPKVRAMEIIAELEDQPRGIYAGAAGYLDYAGNLDTCIAIRTMVLSHGRARFQAGAGIVADSIPEREYQECHNKAEVLVRALQLAESL